MNSQLDFERLRLRATRAFNEDDIETALALSEKMAETGDIQAIYTCGLIYGGLDGFENLRDLEKAWSYFQRLALNFNIDEGYLGCVRILLARREADRWELALDYCRAAIDLSNTQFGWLLLGDVLSKLHPNPDKPAACRAYLKAAMGGAPWGWRRFAEIKWAGGNYVFAAFIHVLATIIFPVYVLLCGFRATRTG